MSNTAGKIDRLRRLLEARKCEERVEAEKSLPVREQKAKSDLDLRPESLKGLSRLEIDLLRLDGGLTSQEEAWLSHRSIPHLNGSFRWHPFY